MTRTTTTLALVLLATPAAAQPPRHDAFGDPLPPGAVARLGSVRLMGDRDPVRAAFSPNGEKLAVIANESYALHVWEVETGRELLRVKPKTFIARVFWLPDGTGLAVTGTHVLDPYLWAFADPTQTPPTGGNQPNAEPAEKTRGFAPSPDGKWLAAGVEATDPKRRVVEIYPLATGKRLADLKPARVLGPFPQGCAELQYTPDGRRLVVGHTDGSARVLDVATGETVSGPVAAQAPAFNLSRIAYVISPDGRLVATAPKKPVRLNGLYESDGTVRVWNLATGKEVASLPHGGTYLSGLAFTSDGGNLISSDLDQSFQVREVATGKLVTRGAAGWYDTEARAIAVSPDGSHFAACRRDGRVDLWDTETGKPIRPPATHRDPVVGVAVSPDGARAVTLGRTGEVRAWDVATGRAGFTAEVTVSPGEHHIWARKAAFTPDGAGVVLKVGDRLGRFDSATGRAAPLPGPLAAAPGQPVGFTADGKSLVTAGADLALWDWPSGAVRRQAALPMPPNKGDRPNLAGHRLMVRAAAMAPDGRFVVASTVDVTPNGRYASLIHGANYLWDVRVDGPARRLADPEPWYPVVAFDPNSGGPFYLGGPCRDATQPIDKKPLQPTDVATAWDPISGKLLARIRCEQQPRNEEEASYTNRLNALAVSPDGRLLAFSPADRNVSFAFLETASGRTIRTLTGHRNRVNALAFTPDGRRLISASDDQTALGWDTRLTAFAGSLKLNRADAWTALAAPDPARAWPVMADLAADPVGAIDLMAAKLKPLPVPSAADLDRLARQFDAPAFADREKAAAELEGYGPNAVAGVRERLPNATSTEVRERFAAFLKRHAGDGPSPEVLRQGRAVAVLEAVGTPAAKAMLTKLAGGDVTAALTREAAAALARVK